jgi:hypothetical protein
MEKKPLDQRRRLSVQEQNELHMQKLLRAARHWRERGLPERLALFLTRKGIDPRRCAVLAFGDESYMLGYENGMAGRVLSAEGRFYDFELEFAPEVSAEPIVHKFEDITHLQNMSAHNPGRGKGEGLMATEILQVLNHAS